MSPPTTGKPMGRPVKFKGFTLVKDEGANPRRKGSHGYNSWEAIRDGMSYEEYLAAGGRHLDLLTEFQRGRVLLTKPDGTPYLREDYTAPVPSP